MDKKKRFIFWPASGAGFKQVPALLTNIHLPNFAKGVLYQGKGKTRMRAGAELLLLPGCGGGLSRSARFRQWSARRNSDFPIILPVS